MRIHPKVAAQTATGTVSGFIVWLLMAVIPAWHTGVPADVQAMIPAVVAVVLGFIAGYLKKDTTQIGWVEGLISRGEALLKDLENVVNGLLNSGKQPPAAS